MAMKNVSYLGKSKPKRLLQRQSMAACSSRKQKWKPFKKLLQNVAKLPGNGIHSKLRFFDDSYPVVLAFSLEVRYSRFMRAIKSRLISFGQTASHDPVTVQFPNPSSSIAFTILRTRRSFSGFP